VLKWITIPVVLALAVPLAGASPDVSGLFGREVATPGPLLAGVVPDKPIPRSVESKLKSLGIEMLVYPVPGSIQLTLTGDNAEQQCEAMFATMKAKWGEPVDHMYFLNPQRRVRARVFFCAFLFEGYVPVEEFVNSTPSSVFPSSLVGKPKAAIEGERRRRGMNEAWALPSIDTSHGDIEIRFEVTHDKVSRVVATTA
jgi:hypothetical protein